MMHISELKPWITWGIVIIMVIVAIRVTVNPSHSTKKSQAIVEKGYPREVLQEFIFIDTEGLEYTPYVNLDKNTILLKPNYKGGIEWKN